MVVWKEFFHCIYLELLLAYNQNSSKENHYIQYRIDSQMEKDRD